MSETGPPRPAERATAEAEPLSPRRFSALRRMLADPRHKVVVSLGGGALPGLCGNLALAALLDELDLLRHVHEIWGTSAGAIIGGGLASGTTVAEMLDIVAGLARTGVRRGDLLRFALGVLRSVASFGRHSLPDGVLDGRAFERAIASGLRAATFEECRIPFRCIACSDDGRSTTRVFRSGPLVPAIYSSMALPGVLRPRPADSAGTTYYDGGLVEKTPLRSPIAEHGRSGDERRLLILSTHFVNEKMHQRASGFLKRFLATLYALEELAWGYQLREVRERDDVVLLLLDPHLPDTSLFGFESTIPNFLHARRAFADALQDAKLVGTLGTY
ncbi:MAG: patatin-like phospholipase family protein [Planctomycetes bacterium]|nr:patatin-like phospholipase family protein [Planctomycetota bacterium]